MTKTDVIRKILANDPETKYSQVKARLEAKGISENYFNVMKNTLKGEQKAPAPKKAKSKPAKAKTEKPAPATVTIEESVAFVTASEGLDKAKAQVSAGEKLIVDYTTLAGEVEKQGGIEAVKANVARRQQMIARFEELATEVRKVA